MIYKNIVKFILCGSSETQVRRWSLALSKLLIRIIELILPSGIYWVFNHSFEGMGDYNVCLLAISAGLIRLTHYVIDEYNIKILEDIRVPILGIPIIGILLYLHKKWNE